MKNIFLIYLFGLFSICCKSQSSFYLDSIQGNAYFKSDCIYYWSGSMLAKSDYDGNIIWAKSLTASNDIEIGEDAIYYLDSIKVVKLDTAGNFIWAKNFNLPVNSASSDSNTIGDIVYDGRRIYISIIQAPPWWSTGGDYYPSVITLDTSGVVLNVVSNHVTPGGSFGLQKCGVILQGGAWIGYNYAPGFTHSTYLVKVDTAGNFDLSSYSPEFFFATVTYLNRIVPLFDSTYLVMTWSFFYNPHIPQQQTFTLTKITSSGSVLWQNDYYNASFSCGTHSTDAYSAGSDSLGNIYVVGAAAENPCSGNNSGGNFYMKLDASGNIVFVKSFTGPGQYPIGINGELKYRNGHMYCSSSFNGHSAVLCLNTTFINSCFNPDSTIVLNKVPQPAFGGSITNPPNLFYSPSFDTASVSAMPFSTKKDLCLTLNASESIFKQEDFSISPNPTSGKLKINNDQLRIESINIYNLFGRKVMSLQSTDEIDLSSFSAGMYIVEISGEDFLWRGKVLKTDY